ncbi:MAG: cob(I)yrinic acid a,c-diamide adenosyltransferase [Deltaproteobacteria bacterium]|nr:cob(I)yrinic acid a,c-diamide adenosyltransferase [Deltaproteobacteria bacterium]
MKIYTKTGDQGKTGLFGGDRVAKDHPRIEAYGSLDEVNSLMGVVLSLEPPQKINEALLRVQQELFVLGSELATPHPSTQMAASFIQETQVKTLEKEIDSWEKDLKPLKQFILPGGTPAAAYLHLARTVCRRAERLVVALAEKENIRSEVLEYLNRLGDWLFVAGRWTNQALGSKESPWSGLKN